MDKTVLVLTHRGQYMPLTFINPIYFFSYLQDVYSILLNIPVLIMNKNGLIFPMSDSAQTPNVFRFKIFPRRHEKFEKGVI